MPISTNRDELLLLTADDLMTRDLLLVAEDIPLGELARIMIEDQVHRIIIVDDKRAPLGIVTSLDLVGAIARLHKSFGNRKQPLEAAGNALN